MREMTFNERMVEVGPRWTGGLPVRLKSVPESRPAYPVSGILKPEPRAPSPEEPRQLDLEKAEHQPVTGPNQGLSRQYSPQIPCLQLHSPLLSPRPWKGISYHFTTKEYTPCRDRRRECLP